MPTLMVLLGIVAVSWNAWLAFRTRVSMSAIGSVMVMDGASFSCGFPWRDLRRGVWVRVGRAGRGASTGSGRDYQEDLVMPGSSPLWDISRKQIRHRPNLRYTARGRPHFWHRVYARTANFGLRACLTLSAVFAISTSSVGPEGEAEAAQQGPALLVGRGRRHEGDVHAPRAVDPVRVDLVEHDLLVEAEGVVTVAVELLR